MNTERNGQNGIKIEIVDRLAELESLRQTAIRMERAGLIVDRSTLSPAHRRTLFALECFAAGCASNPEPRRAPIGFAYPNAR
jgi:hypothetical protein